MLFTDASQRLSRRELRHVRRVAARHPRALLHGTRARYDPATPAARAGDRRPVLPERRRAVGRRPGTCSSPRPASYRIWKVDARRRATSTREHSRRVGRRAGPGDRSTTCRAFPDNLTRSAAGRLWTGLTKPRSRADRPGRGEARGCGPMTLRLPKSLWPVPPAYGHVHRVRRRRPRRGRPAGPVRPDCRRPAASRSTTAGSYVHSLHAGAFGILDAAAAAPPPPVGSARRIWTLP